MPGDEQIMPLMQLTHDIVSRYAGGQIEVQNAGEDYLALHRCMWIRIRVGPVEDPL